MKVSAIYWTACKEYIIMLAPRNWISGCMVYRVFTYRGTDIACVVKTPTTIKRFEKKIVHAAQNIIKNSIGSSGSSMHSVVERKL